MTKNTMVRIKRYSRRKFISDLGLGTIGVMGGMLGGVLGGGGMLGGIMGGTGFAGTGGFHRLSGRSQPLFGEAPYGKADNIRMITRPPGYHWFGYYDK